MLGRSVRTLYLAMLLGDANLAQAQVPPAAQTTPPSASSLRAGLAGKWTGSLGYRDHQTDKMSELSVRTAISVVPDRLTQLRTSEFDEGPGRKPVWITTASIDEPSVNRVTSTSFSAGRAPEL